LKNEKLKRQARYVDKVIALDNKVKPEEITRGSSFGLIRKQKTSLKPIKWTGFNE